MRERKLYCKDTLLFDNVVREPNDRYVMNEIPISLLADKYSDKSSYEALGKSLSEVNVGIETVWQKSVMEEDKSKNWKKENMRRKHKLCPFPLQFLQDSCR